LSYGPKTLAEYRREVALLNNYAGPDEGLPVPEDMPPSGAWSFQRNV